MSCKADDRNQFYTEAEAVSVTVGQLIQRRGRSEMWESVGVYAERDDDGTLVVRVMVFNPDWDEPLQIACIRSHPHDVAMNTAPLGCSLDHAAL